MSILETEPPTVSPSDSCLEGALQRISVRRPYFGFDEIERIGTTSVRALVPQAPPELPETGCIDAAQASRHLAILGSCNAALTQETDNRHHYLAVEARFTRAAGSPEAPGSGPLVAEAMTSWEGRRTARSLVTLRTSTGQAINLLDVSYAVMTPRMFDRLYPPETTACEPEPGSGVAKRENQLSLGAVEPTATGVRIDCGAVSLDSCAGHFPGTPAAPVALVMGQLCRAGGHALSLRLGATVQYRIEEAHVTATKLARAGQRLVLEASYEEPVGDLHRLRGHATADGEIVGSVDVLMSAHVARHSFAEG